MKTLIIVSAFFIFISQTFANLHQAPPNLSLDRGSQGIFVDFLRVKSLITYNIAKKEALATTTIIFYQPKEGKPLFDLVPNPARVQINAQEAQTKIGTMGKNYQIRYLDKVLPSGTHTLKIANRITKNIAWNKDHVRSAFWMSDLNDRRYLEQYLPTNLEFDQYKNQFEIKVFNNSSEQTIHTNGQVRRLAKNHWAISYPATYTASSLYFHMIKKGSVPETRAQYRSIDGRMIPIVVYTRNTLSTYMKRTLSILAELEKDYGPWPHSQVIIYGAGAGGMEYCGATITSLSALGHELTHSYFARGVMPAHGNAGWVDEAIASWRDKGYPSYSASRLSRTKMAAHSVYRRSTDRDAYSKGMKFIGYLNKKFAEKESFKVFLKSFFQERKFKPFKTPEFQKAIESYYNTNLSDDFNKYIYAKRNSKVENEAKSTNPYHPHLSEQDLMKLL